MEKQATWQAAPYSELNDLVCEWHNSLSKAELVSYAENHGIPLEGAWPEEVLDEARRQVLAALALDTSETLLALGLWGEV